MVDTTFVKLLPPIKAVDLGDGTYAVSVVIMNEAAVPSNTTFRNVLPPLKAIDLGDGTYGVSVIFE